MIPKRKMIVGISGASGAIYGKKLIEQLIQHNIETHVVMSMWAKKNLVLEDKINLERTKELADFTYSNHDLSAPIASGSRLYDAMFIVPTSMKTLSSIANGFSDTLISRAADICLKEHRPLILSPRETPLNTIHLENMLKLSRLGVRIVPPMPAFYNEPKDIEDLIDHHVMKLLDQVGIHIEGKRYLEND